MSEHKHTATARERERQVIDEPVEVEAGHRSLLQLVPAIVCELAWDGTTLFVNDAVAKITGYQPDELQGRNWWHVFFPADLHRQVDDLYRRLRAGDVTGFEMAIRAKDGSPRTLAWSFSRNGTNGRPKWLVGSATDITEHQRVDDELRQSVAKLRRALEGTVEAIAMTVEIRDPYTAGHQRRVAALASAIAEEMGLSEEQIRAIRLAGTIHDIGKISVPAKVLGKRGAMTKAEITLLRAHPEVGYAILNMIDFPWPVARIVHQHHERFDGSGYPLGLSGDAILLEAKILAVADVVEAMAGPRPYRPALGIDKAVKEISSQRGVLYDPDVVDACLKVLRQMKLEWD